MCTYIFNFYFRGLNKESLFCNIRRTIYWYENHKFNVPFTAYRMQCEFLTRNNLWPQSQPPPSHFILKKWQGSSLRSGLWSECMLLFKLEVNTHMQHDPWPDFEPTWSCTYFKPQYMQWAMQVDTGLHPTLLKPTYSGFACMSCLRLSVQWLRSWICSFFSIIIKISFIWSRQSNHLNIWLRSGSGALVFFQLSNPVQSNFKKWCNNQFRYFWTSLGTYVSGRTILNSFACNETLKNLYTIYLI